MNARLKGACLVAAVIFAALSERPAHAAEGPLLVVVEAPPALDADAAEIRRAIGTELHAHTIAPMSTPAEAPGRALIVALDGDRIAISLRANDGTSVTRVIHAPAEHAARLRAIAWLAGNLARDQVSPILAEAPAEPSAPATIPALPYPPAPRRSRRPAATEPPPALALPSTTPSAERHRRNALPPGAASKNTRARFAGRSAARSDRSFHERFGIYRLPAQHRLADHVQRRREHDTARHRGNARRDLQPFWKRPRPSAHRSRCLRGRRLALPILQPRG